MSKNPTKAELKAEISKILKDANLEETAAKKVRLQLEQNLKCDLSNRKKEVDDLVMEYVNSQASSDEEEEEDDEDDDDYAGNGKGKSARKAKDNSDYEEEEEEKEDFSEEEKPKGRKSGTKRTTPAKRGPAKKKKRTSDSEDESGDDDDEDQGSDDDYKPQGVAKGGKAGKKKKNDSDSDSDGDWKRSKPAAKGKKAAGGGGAKKSSGYTRPYTLSADLAAICGAESLPRHEVVKKIWAIIKERNLYDPKNRQYAICDDDLHKVIGVKRFRTFGMLKYLKPHFKD
ncbi:uncharacterized protein LOC126558731 [Anopheles maculipalpis]|uniref:uncharacterized protein LOC126558731 n=1 Tax=Anopheles maculipalpis TaxID=1496333 RepID=UPI002158A573|nr:uncharacterized protein LOC126558731 [Anopheles maculipalpis]